MGAPSSSNSSNSSSSSSIASSAAGTFSLSSAPADAMFPKRAWTPAAAHETLALNKESVSRMVRCFFPLALALLSAAAAGFKTHHGCTCVDADECSTNGFYAGLRWCRTTSSCTHDVLSHTWDYCESREDVEEGRPMCEVWRERGQHSGCGARSGPGNWVVEILFSLWTSCYVQCSDVASAIVGTIVALLALGYVLFKFGGKGGKRGGKRRRR